MIFERKKYLDELIAGRGNGLVKIITGVRRCGKSFLLFDIWHNWLLEHGVTDSHIIEIQLDDFRNRRLRKPDALLDYIDSKVVDDGKPYYIVLDEVQLVEEFVEVILSLTHMRNVDVYVSGSNSRFLSSDVVTEFRGRGDEIRIYNPQNEAFLHSRTSRAISQNETYRRNTPYPPLKNRPAYAGIHIL